MSYRAVNTPSLGLKKQPFNYVQVKIAVCSDIHTQHINAICGHNVACFNAKLKKQNTSKNLLHSNYVSYEHVVYTNYYTVTMCHMNMWSIPIITQ
jgi:hypothetical protein